jgi:hypothetical protein
MIHSKIPPGIQPEILNPYSVSDLYYVVRPAPDLCFQL